MPQADHTAKKESSESPGDPKVARLHSGMPLRTTTAVGACERLPRFLLRRWPLSGSRSFRQPEVDEYISRTTSKRVSPRPGAPRVELAL